MLWCSRTRVNVNLLGEEGFAAFRTDQDRIEHVSAVLVLVEQGAATFLDHVRVAPMYGGDNDRIEIQAALGQDILETSGAVLVARATQDAETHELFETLREQVPRDSQLRLKLLETTNSKEAFAKD